MTRVFALIVSLTALCGASPLEIRLPTENKHLFTGELDRFYMYVNRTFEGETSQPWEAGSYGFVRTAVRVGGEVLLTKFHEGIDISPIKRDQAGNPLDLVSSIAAGRVVHTSPISGRSNYGKYVVVEHRWEDSSVYSLYAHLAEITVNPGDTVNVGSVLGRMGYTGAGIDRVRAHLHLEIGMMVSSQFNEWHQKSGAGTNYHGLFNGMNLTSADPARLFVEHKANPSLKFSEFIASTPVYFKVTIPSPETPDFVKRHPWIARGSADGAKSWEISFSATGLPVAFSSSQREVSEPVLTSVRPSAIPHRYLTRGLVTGEGNRAELTSSGKQLVTLLTGDHSAAP